MKKYKKLTTKEFSFIFLPWMVVKELVWPLTTVVKGDPLPLVPFTKWSLIVNKGSWLDTVDTESGVVGGVCCEFWNCVAWKKAVVEGITRAVLPPATEEEVVMAGISGVVLTAKASRCCWAWAWATAWTAAETAVLKPVGVVGSAPDEGSGPSRSWKTKKIIIDTQIREERPKEVTLLGIGGW